MHFGLDVGFGVDKSPFSSNQSVLPFSNSSGNLTLLLEKPPFSGSAGRMSLLGMIFQY